MLARTLCKWAAAAVLALGLFLVGDRAEAQYKNGQIGFEGGYFFLTNTGSEGFLDPHGFLLALRGGYKGTDHWWFTARAGVSFRGEEDPLSNRTVVMFNLMPVDARYYFLTDNFRPFVGVGSTFNFLFNQSIETSVIWGPQATAGLEFRLRRDMFLGFQADAGWNFVFEGSDAPFVTLTSQLIFFL